MKKFAKVLTLSLAVVLVLGALSGCKKEGPTTADGTPIISYFMPLDPGMDFTSDTWVIKNWGEKTGTSIEIIPIQRDVFNEKIAAVFASKDFPDLINYYQDEKTVNKYGPRLFVSLTEYLEDGKLPNLQKLLEEYPDIYEKNTRLEDDQLYGFPAYKAYDQPFAAWSIREDILNKAGWSAKDIKTEDDLKEALLAMKKVSGHPYVTTSRLGWNYFAEMTGYMFGTSPYMMYDNRTSQSKNEWIYGPTGHMFKEWVEFYRWAYENEVIHPDFDRMSEQECYAGYSDGSIQLSMEQAGGGPMLSSYLPKYYGTRTEAPIYGFEINGEVPKQPMVYHSHNGYRWPVTVTKSSGNVEHAMRAMDWLYSEEGINESKFGREGIDWVKDEDYGNGIRTMIKDSYYQLQRLANGEITQAEYDALPSRSDLCTTSAWLSPARPSYEGFATSYHKDDKRSKEMSEFVIDMCQTIIDRGYTCGTDPVVKFTEEEQEEIDEILATLETFVSEKALNFIKGKLPMEEFDAFQAEVRAMGADRLAEMYNAKMK